MILEHLSLPLKPMNCNCDSEVGVSSLAVESLGS